MLQKIEILISKDFEEIASSPLSLLLLDCYSKLYLNGAQPKYCKASQLYYFNEILKTGKKMAQKFDETNKRTFVLKRPKGLIYAGKPICKHFNLELMTDEEAKKLLSLGIMKNEMFEKLPESEAPEVKPETTTSKQTGSAPKSKTRKKRAK